MIQEAQTISSQIPRGFNSIVQPYFLGLLFSFCKGAEQDRAYQQRCTQSSSQSCCMAIKTIDVLIDVSCCQEPKLGEWSRKLRADAGALHQRDGYHTLDEQQQPKACTSLRGAAMFHGNPDQLANDLLIQTGSSLEPGCYQ